MRDLVRFFALVYGVTWTWWITVALLLPAPPAEAPEGFRGLLFLPGTVAPALVALALTARTEGQNAVRNLITRIFEYRVAARWYLFAAGYTAAIEFAVAIVHRLVTGAWPMFGGQAIYVMALAIAVSMWIQAGEEVGWRGYALPRLAGRIGLGPASLLLGAIWASWHLPLFFIPGASTTGQSFPVYLIQVTALSVAMAWLYWRVNGSLLLPMLMHAAVNNTKDIVPSAVSGASNVFSLSSSLVAWLTAVVMWVTAMYFLINMRGVTLESTWTDPSAPKPMDGHGAKGV